MILSYNLVIIVNINRFSIINLKDPKQLVFSICFKDDLCPQFLLSFSKENFIVSDDPV